MSSNRNNIHAGDTFSIGGVDYSVTSTQRIAGDNTMLVNTDLLVFQISAPLDLPGLHINSQSLFANSDAILIGNGGTLSWGTSKISNPAYTSYSWVLNPDTGVHEVNGTTSCYWAAQSNSTPLDPSPLNPYTITTHAENRDFGGASFSFNSITQTWELSGIILEETAVTIGFDSGTASYALVTNVIDASSYYSQVSTITGIPENPTSTTLAFGSLLLSLIGFVHVRSTKKLTQA